MSKELNIGLGQSGLAVTANVYLLGVAKATGIVCAEIGAIGVYAGDFSATPNVAGVYQIAFFSNGASVACGGGQIVWDGSKEVVQTGDNFVRLGAPAAGSIAADIAAVSDNISDPLSSPVPGSYPSGTAGAALGLLGVGSIVTVAGPISATSDVTIVHGDDYLAADSRALIWSGAGWPDLTGGAVQIVLSNRGGPFAGAITASGGAMQTLRLELSDAQTAALSAGTGRYAVRATLADGSIVTLGSGLWIVKLPPDK